MAIAALRATLAGGLVQVFDDGSIVGPFGTVSSDGNVKSYGAIGSAVSTTTSATFSSGTNTVTLTDASAFKIGSGIGIQGAGAAGIALRATVANVSGNVVTLNVNAGTTVSSGAAVSSDDSIPIQTAITANAKVYIPTGTYIIGVPGAYDNATVINQPLKFHSNMIIYGDGVGLTTLKLANNVRQLIPASQSQPCTGVFKSGASIFVNDKNQGWYTGVSGNTTNVEIFNLSLQGNKNEQPNDYQKGDKTGGVIAKPKPSVMFTNDATVGSLVTGHRYAVGITYADGSGNETATGGVIAGPAISGTSVKITIPPTPGGVTSIFVYMHDLDAPADLDACGNRRYERKGPLAVPGSSFFILTSHAAATVHAPGTVINSPGNAAADFGVWADHADNIYVHDLEATDFVLEGIMTSAIENSRFTAIKAHKNGRMGGAITGDANGVRWFACRFVNNEDGGFDIEPAYVNALVKEVSFFDCTLSDNSGAGIYGAFGFFTGCLLDGLTLNNCNISRNLWGVRLQTSGGTPSSTSKMQNVILANSVIQNNANTGFGCNFLGSGVITGCSLDSNGRVPDTSPEYNSAAAVAGQIAFSNSTSGWRIASNRIRPFSTISQSAIFLQDAASINFVIENNVFDSDGGAANVLLTLGGPSTKHVIRNNSCGTAAVHVDEQFSLFPSWRPRLCSETGTASVGAAAVTVGVTFSVKMLNSNYNVNFDPSWDSGTWFVTSKTDAGFTFNWTTPPGGGGGTVNWSVSL